jgi:hypothetical protein
MSGSKDRLLAVAASTAYNGVDYVDVTAPTALVVHFLNAVAIADPTLTVTITGGDSIPTVAINPITAADWKVTVGKLLLTITTLGTGDFSRYTLTLAAPKLDLILNTAGFSFRPNCPSDFDCAPPPGVCPALEVQPPPIDYLARDFQSFQQALLAFSALRYPDWVERSEADFGMMMSELLSAVGDEFSYLQDRVAAEASFATATQRRSLVSLARLVDYEPDPALSATTLLQCNVTEAGTVAAGARVSALAPDGTPVPFEIGTGLADISNYPVNPLWNFIIAPYWFDDSEECLPAAATSVWVFGHGFNFTPGQQILIQTDLPGESLRQIVTLIEAGDEAVDEIFLTNGQPTPVTQLTWRSSDALTNAHDLTRTTLGGNLLPATQGARFTEIFAIGTAPPSAPGAQLAIARVGPNGSASSPNYVYRYPLTQSPLGWLANADTTQPPAPEIILTQTLPNLQTWAFGTTLLESLSTDTDFTVDPVAWQPVGRGPTGQPIQWDILGDQWSNQGSAIRFGTNVFGACPAEGDLFTITYRTGLGASGNVAADSITTIDPATQGLLAAVRNPFAVTNGADAETAANIATMAPQAFQAVQYRAVRASDYEAAAETLPWVNKAATSFRWTGSWMTVFTAADPLGGAPISVDEDIQLIELLNRYRLAGYESYAPPPDYVSVDLRIEVCTETGWRNGDVEASVLRVLGSASRPNDASGFFFADRFSFGTPLYRSRLEAAIQDAPGVLGVRGIQYRQRGNFVNFKRLPETLTPAPSQILRVDNDPSWPERGTIRVIVEGGS